MWVGLSALLNPTPIFFNFYAIIVLGIAAFPHNIVILYKVVEEVMGQHHFLLR
jgi:hypothetical protein